MSQRLKIIINTGAIKNNIRQIKKRLEPSTQIMAVVKADGYGHGAAEVAKAALPEGVKNFGVAVVEEGVLLRRELGAGINILIMGAAFSENIDNCIKHNLIQAIPDYESAALVSNAATKQGREAAVHIKIDTGMNRMGFFPNTGSIAEIVRISKMSNISITGIYSHFAQAEEKGGMFSYKQAQLFTEFYKKLQNAGVNIPVKHMSNSAAILTAPQFQFDMVRPGIAVYGLPPSPEIDMTAEGFIPALSMVSCIKFLKEIPAGTSIGYNRSFFTKRKSKIATIPVGYADAYPRALANCGKVIINGKFAYVTGNICMDQMMADVTDIEDVAVDDEVILIGTAGGGRLTAPAGAIAKAAGTSCYETVCAVGNGRRGKKIYVETGAY